MSEELFFSHKNLIRCLSFLQETDLEIKQKADKAETFGGKTKTLILSECHRHE